MSDLENSHDETDNEPQEDAPHAQSFRRPRSFTPPGHYSNKAITRRNGGVVHRFLDSIGGCSANYR